MWGVIGTLRGNSAAAHGSSKALPSAPRTGPLSVVLLPHLSGLGFFGKHQALQQLPVPNFGLCTHTNTHLTGGLVCVIFLLSSPSCMGLGPDTWILGGGER